MADRMKNFYRVVAMRRAVAMRAPQPALASAIPSPIYAIVPSTIIAALKMIPFIPPVPSIHSLRHDPVSCFD